MIKQIYVDAWDLEPLIGWLKTKPDGICGVLMVGCSGPAILTLLMLWNEGEDIRSWFIERMGGKKLKFLQVTPGMVKDLVVGVVYEVESLTEIESQIESQLEAEKYAMKEMIDKRIKRLQDSAIDFPVLFLQPEVSGWVGVKGEKYAELERTFDSLSKARQKKRATKLDGILDRLSADLKAGQKKRTDGSKDS